MGLLNVSIMAEGSGDVQAVVDENGAACAFIMLPAYHRARRKRAIIYGHGLLVSQMICDSTMVPLTEICLNAWAIVLLVANNGLSNPSTTI